MRREVILMTGAALIAALVMAGCGKQSGSPRATVTTAVAATAPATSGPSPATTTPAESVTTTPAEPVATGLLARAGNGVLFIQWTRTPTAVDGTFTSVYTSTDDPTQLHTDTNSFTGIVSGSNVTLTMDTGTKWIGTLNGRNATLSFTASDGTISSWTFTPATTDEYNQAVAEVKSGAATAQSEKQQADATAKAQAQIDSDASTLTSDIANLREAVSELSKDLGVVPGHLNTMRSDLALQLKHLRAFLAAGGFADSCSNGDSYQVSSTDNYQVVSTDDYQITSTDDYAIGNDLEALTNGIGKLNQDARQAASDQAAMPSYSPAGIPTGAAIQAATTAANAAIASGGKRREAYLATVKKLDAQSDAYTARVDKACGN